MKRERLIERKLFSVTLVDGHVTFKRGAHVTRVDKNGEQRDHRYDANTVAWGNVGDCFVIIGMEVGSGMIELGYTADGETFAYEVLRGPLHNGSAHALRFKPRKRAKKIKLKSVELG